MDAAVAVAVGYEEIAEVADGDAGGHIEGAAGLFHQKALALLAGVGRVVAGAEGEQQFALGVALFNDVRVSVRQIDIAVVVHADAVRLFVPEIP